MWQIDARQLVAKIGILTAINDSLRACKRSNNSGLKLFYSP